MISRPLTSILFPYTTLFRSVAEKNSVRAVKLFTIEKYQTVYQMISTVEAKVKEDLSLGGIFNALFPCGSITGAPKIMTDRKSTRLNSSHVSISYAVFCLKKK